jgi:hypothetical protein
MGIFSPVDGRFQKLAEQVAVPGMHFHRIQRGFFAIYAARPSARTMSRNYPLVTALSDGKPGIKPHALILPVGPQVFAPVFGVVSALCPLYGNRCGFPVHGIGKPAKKWNMGSLGRGLVFARSAICFSGYVCPCSHGMSPAAVFLSHSISFSSGFSAGYGLQEWPTR